MAQMIKTSPGKSLAQLISSFFYLLIFPVAIFLLAGDWRWVEGWLFSLTHRGFGLIGNVLVAFLGAFLGFLFSRFAAATMSEDGLIYGIAALVGAVFGGQVMLRVSRNFGG